MSHTILALACLAVALAPARASEPQTPPVGRGYTIPLLDPAREKHRQVVVDREENQYLSHPTTVLLEDGRTILAAYPRGHGKGAIVLKRSTDGGLTWSDRLPVPANWPTSQGAPTIHRLIDPQGKKRLVLFSGLYPIRMESSEDDGRTWTPLEPIGGIVAMASVERPKNGAYMARFHDGRFRKGKGKRARFRVHKSISRDGSYPGVEVLPSGMLDATTCGYWTEGEQPYIVSMRFTLAELDTLAKAGPNRAAPETKAPAPGHATVTVTDADGLRRALADAVPGTTICIAPGHYRGGISARWLRGEPGRPIVLAAADPGRPPVFEGGDFGWHLSDPAHIELHDLAVANVRGNGINIDDGGSYDSPAHHVVLRGLVVRDIGPEGNRDGIKLSGVDDFRVEGCTVERWGSGGSGIDMVGCHRGEVTGCTFRHGDRRGDHGVQAKGGSCEVVIRRCRFEHAGQRAVNLGGSTGLAYFRPRPQGYEAKDITVEDCTFLGSMAPVAFVGVDGAAVRYNTIYRPGRWSLRILRENNEGGFVPCRNGRFTDNLIAFRSDEMATAANVGPGTAPESFTLARNAWYCLDAPQRSRPRLPTAEADGVYGVDPRFRNAEAGDLRTQPDGPALHAGVRAERVTTGEGKP
jgi:hypothetical protein